MNAFPVAFPAGCEGWEDGMTLRDYFAAQALLGILSGRAPNTFPDRPHMVALSYAFADTMLEARGE